MGPATAPVLPAGYPELLERLKADIRTTRVRAAAAANRELIALYWRIGRAVVERHAGEPWGSGVLERLATDLRRAFPGVAGFSRANLFRVRAFYLAWGGAPGIVAQPARQLAADTPADAEQAFAAAVPPAVAQLLWGHNVVLLERVKDPAARRLYAVSDVERGPAPPRYVSTSDPAMRRDCSRAEHSAPGVSNARPSCGL